MVWTKSAAAAHRVAGDTDPNDAASCIERNSTGRAESVRLSGTSHSSAACPNAAARISESRADSRAGDH